MSTPRMIEVKLIDGPLAGRLMTIPASSERINIGPLPNPFFVYTYAGKDGPLVMFAKRPTARLTRRLIRRVIENTGQHPAVKFQFYKGTPIVGKTNKRGQGARRREAARKLRAEQAAWRDSDGYNGR